MFPGGFEMYILGLMISKNVWYRFNPWTMQQIKHGIVEDVHPKYGSPYCPGSKIRGLAIDLSSRNRNIKARQPTDGIQARALQIV